MDETTEVPEVDAGQQPVAGESQQNQVDATSEAYTQQIVDLQAAARAHLAKGEWEPAVAKYQEAIALAEAAGDTAGKAEGLNNIASVYLALEEWEQAMTFASESRALYQQVGDRGEEAVVLNNVAAAHDGMGDWPQAIAIYDEALELRQSVGDQEGEARTLRNLAILYAQHGNRPKAKSYLNRALVAAKQAKANQLLGEIRKTMSQLPRMRRR